MGYVTVAVHGRVVHKRQYQRRATSGGGRAIVSLRQLLTGGRKVKAANFVYYDVVRVGNAMRGLPTAPPPPLPWPPRALRMMSADMRILRRPHSR